MRTQEEIEAEIAKAKEVFEKFKQFPPGTGVEMAVSAMCAVVAALRWASGKPYNESSAEGESMARAYLELWSPKFTGKAG